MSTHRTPRYILARLRELVFQKLNPEAPWIGPEAVCTLVRLLTPEMHGLECGSGRSTAWVAQRVTVLESWEESAEWMAKTSALLSAKGLQNVVLKSVFPTPASYQKLLQEIGEEILHFALVDSENCRDFLCVELIPKIRKGGFLMLDNANWFLPSSSRAPHSRSYKAGPANELWKRFLEETADWKCLWTSSGVTDTAFFVRPEEGGSGKSI